jgi:hypothetical protein
MNNQKAENPYLGKVLDAYHLSVKRWGRDVLIAAFVIVTAWIMIVLPYLQWSEEKQRNSDAQRPVQMELDNKEPFLKKVLAIECEFKQEEKDIADYAKKLVAILVWRMEGFVESIKSAREGRSIDLKFWKSDSKFREFFNRSDPSQTVTEPDMPPGPREILSKVYHLSEEDIKTVTSTEASPQETQEPKKASKIVEDLFQNEIKSVYEKLNNRVKTDFAKLQTSVENRLMELALEAKEKKFDVNLPDTNDIILKFEKIDQPKGTKLFRTVEAKGETLEEEAKKIITNIESAQTPVEKVRLALVTSVEALKNSVKNLEADRAEQQKKIVELQGYIDNARKQLVPFKTPFSLPWKWIPPLKIKSFVRGYPIFVSVVYLILALRYSRLSKLRKRLYQQCGKQGMGKEDIDFAMYVPGSPLDWFFGLGFASKGILRAAHIAGPVLVFGLILGAIWHIETNTVFDKDFAVLPHVCSIAFCLLGCFYFLHNLLKK